MCSMWKLSTRNNTVPLRTNTNVICFVSCLMYLWYPWPHSSHIVCGTPDPNLPIHSLALHIMVSPFAGFSRTVTPGLVTVLCIHTAIYTLKRHF
jgi:hypothetical protein